MDIVIEMLCPTSVDVDSPALEVFEASLDGACTNLVQWKCPAHGTKWSLSPFHPKPFHDSMIILAFKLLQLLGHTEITWVFLGQEQKYVYTIAIV